VGEVGEGHCSWPCFVAARLVLLDRENARNQLPGAFAPAPEFSAMFEKEILVIGKRGSENKIFRDGACWECVVNQV
jgi:hypothetical protein